MKKEINIFLNSLPIHTLQLEIRKQREFSLKEVILLSNHLKQDLSNLETTFMIYPKTLWDKDLKKRELIPIALLRELETLTDPTVKRNKLESEKTIKDKEISWEELLGKPEVSEFSHILE